MLTKNSYDFQIEENVVDQLPILGGETSYESQKNQILISQKVTSKKIKFSSSTVFQGRQCWGMSMSIDCEPTARVKYCENDGLQILLKCNADKKNFRLFCGGRFVKPLTVRIVAVGSISVHWIVWMKIWQVCSTCLSGWSQQKMFWMLAGLLKFLMDEKT